VGVQLLHENLDPDPAPASSSSSSVRRTRGRAPEENWPAIYADPEPLVVVLQSHLKRPANQRGALRGPIPYPPVLAVLRTTFRVRVGTVATALPVTADDVSLEETPHRRIDFSAEYVGPYRTSSLALPIRIGFYTKLPGTSWRTF
jgi:hypothetical protein